MPAPALHDLWQQHLAQCEAEEAATKAANAAPPKPAPKPAPTLDLPADFDVAAALEHQLEPSRRADGWTAQAQHDFLRAIATGATIEGAARAQGLSAASAYSFRHSAKGAAFAIGWTAAQLLQRQRLADTVAARAFEGQVVTVTRPDGSTYERHFHDNRLAMSVLTRLDRIAAGQLGSGTPDTTGEGQAARLAAAEWDRYLDILAGADGKGGGPARAGLFLAARTLDAGPGAPELAALSTLARADLYARTGAGMVAEVDATDLDPAARAGWTAAQWARAEAAGLLTVAPAPTPEKRDGTTQYSQHSPDDEEEDDPVWWDNDAREYRTTLPFADDDGGGLPLYELGDYGDDDYQRSLTETELEAVEAAKASGLDEARAAGLARRAAWLADLRAQAAGDGDDEEHAEDAPPSSPSPRRGPGPGSDATGEETPSCITGARIQAHRPSPGWSATNDTVLFPIPPAAPLA